MKRIINLSLLAFIAIFISACYPGGAEYTSDTDVIYTDYNPEFNFGGINTYYLADSINHIVDEGQEPDYSIDKFIVGELQRNFDNLGWTRLDSNDVGAGQKPDVAIVLSAIRVTNYNIYTSPWYPGWGWGYYWKSTQYWGYPGYGWGYPWYGGTYVTSYETGTLSWKMFDPDNVDEENEIIYVDWTGAVNGVLGTSSQTTKDRISRGVDQAFKQSPYLIGK